MTIRRRWPISLTLMLLMAVGPGHASPVPKEALLAPPENATHYVVVSDAGKHGDIWKWTLPDQRIAYRHSQSLRGWITEMDEVVRVRPDGLPESLSVRGISPSGDAAESFLLSGANAVWRSVADSGSKNGRTGFYLPAGGVRLSNELLVNRLVAAGRNGLDLLPDGHATISIGPEIKFTHAGGTIALKLAFVRGAFGSPTPVWLDTGNRYFGEAGSISLLPAGFETIAKALRESQNEAIAVEMRAIARKFLKTDARAPILFDNVRLFDADRGVFIDNQAVLASDGKIAAVDRAGSIAAPAGAKVIDGAGKTLVPGLWDSHMHIGDDWEALSLVANGITSFRSPGTTIERARSIISRRNSGDLLVSEPFISVMIDRKDPLAAQFALTVSSAGETVAAVRRVGAEGLWGVKFYTSMDPAWIAPAAAEAHRLGLHVHGHVPATMRPIEAIRVGYDEITHLNFVLMQFMPREVVDKANTAARVEGPAKYTKDLDLLSAEVDSFISELKAAGTVVDPTLEVFERLLGQAGGTTAPAYESYVGIISPAMDRSFKAGGHPLMDGYTRADYRKSFSRMVELVGLLHKAGIPIVAGTDGAGIELFRELELYQIAGLSPSEALRSATIIPARVMGVEQRTGSIRVGKEADMVLVDGDVSKDLGALRRVVTVVSDGYVMDGKELRAATGYSGRPR